MLPVFATLKVVRKHVLNRDDDHPIDIRKEPGQPKNVFWN